MIPLINLNSTQFLKGISAGKYLPNGIFKYATGVDLFRAPDTYGLIEQGYSQTNVTGSVIKDEIRYFVKSGSTFYAYGEDGYLYSITSAGVPTVLDSGHEATRTGGKGLALYNDDATSVKLFYFQSTQIGLYNLSSSVADDDYKTGLTSGEHSAIEFNGILYYTNGSAVGSLNQSTNTLSALALPSGYLAKDIKVWSNYLAIIAQNYSNGSSKLFLWDTITTGGYNFEYIIPELCTALQNCGNDLAIFGSNVRLFNGGSFPVIAEINTSSTIDPGDTCYKDNTLFWKDWDRVMAYGSPVSYIPKLLYCPLKVLNEAGTGSYSGAIAPLDSESNQFLIGTTDKKLYIYNTGRNGGDFETIKLPVGHSRTNKVLISFDTTAIAAAPAEMYLRVYGDKGLIIEKSLSLSTSNLHTEIPIPSNYPTDFVSIRLGNDSTKDVVFKSIILYGTPSEQPV